MHRLRKGAQMIRGLVCFDDEDEPDYSVFGASLVFCFLGAD